MAISPNLDPPKNMHHGILFPEGEFWSDEPPLETDLHLRQILLLIQCLEWAWRDREDFFATGNLTIYFSPQQKKSEDFRGPDFFVVLGTTRRSRRSWVVWQEGGKYPNVIIEVLSDSTAQVDRGEKKQIYQDIFRTPDYFWFDPESLEFEGFRLMGGRYEPLQSNEKGWLWSQQLGFYLGIHETKLRYFTAEGELVPTPEEAALQAQERLSQERQRLSQERQRSEQERQKVEKLATKLRELGIDPEAV